jgi:hypothetical protein
MLAAQRYYIEQQARTIELTVDLNDLRKIAAFEKKPLEPILDELNKMGITSIGVFEETLPDAAAAGEIYYTKGSGLARMTNLNPAFNQLVAQGLVKPTRTYVYLPEENVRKRIVNQLSWALGKKNLKFLNKEVIEVNEAEEEIRPLGLGISESLQHYLTVKGFRIIPRVWHDPHYNLGNLDAKVAGLSDFDTIIFDGEEILGYKDSLNILAAALKKYKIKYGYIEIVKQDGDKVLRKLMGQQLIRVHSIPKDELKKCEKDEVINRFVRAARERKISLIYLRPFLPPQIDAFPVAYNLKYFQEVKNELVKAGYTIAPAERMPALKVDGWQILLLGAAVIVGLLFLLNCFFRLNIIISFLLLLISLILIIFIGVTGHNLILQKGLALLAAIVFPSLAVINSFSRLPRQGFLLWDCTFILLNIIAETLIGVFLQIGLLADTRFMLGIETFAGVKLALAGPIMIVALYFILKQGSGGFWSRLNSFLNQQVKLSTIIIGVVVLGGLVVYLARSGNFTLPVPALEAYARDYIETLFYIRPRTKEFLIGYPLLLMAAWSILRGRKEWFWLLAALGTIGPISLLNTFSHIHTPLTISFIRTVNGLVIGVVIGIILVWLVDHFLKKELTT